MESVGQVITRPTVGWLRAEHSCTKRLTPASHSASPFISGHCLVELDCGGVDPYVPRRLTIPISDLLQRVVVVPSPWCAAACPASLVIILRPLSAAHACCVLKTLSMEKPGLFF